jgi:hypothetical protein
LDACLSIAPEDAEQHLDATILPISIPLFEEVADKLKFRFVIQRFENLYGPINGSLFLTRL